MRQQQNSPLEWFRDDWCVLREYHGSPGLCLRVLKIACNANVSFAHAQLRTIKFRLFRLCWPGWDRSATSAYFISLNKPPNVIGEKFTPQGYALHPNYPNPFNPATTIQFAIGKQSMVKLKVFDILGKEIATLVNQELIPGTHKVIFEANDLPSGFYFYRLETDGFAKTRGLTLLK